MARYPVMSTAGKYLHFEHSDVQAVYPTLSGAAEGLSVQTVIPEITGGSRPLIHFRHFPDVQVNIALPCEHFQAWQYHTPAPVRVFG
ncbi:hypothetical protein Xentx_03622 [Xenorhabdus thuongxuanensis]|uniref:Uncharacterized protein n=1 Tax=Xenorhabdus thuongxuanensis TaxID=1873484 RepID=A0A1Q5TF41_9GAMM|nr:hypothetical protein Xentx_03622 [Xenorhabdus thuongxuanensis]